MYFGKEAFELLARPFPVDNIKFRPGNANKAKTMALPLAYIDQRDAITRLNEVLGPENWGCEYLSDGARLTCALSLAVDKDTFIIKSNGAGDTDFEGTKGGYSDAFKRAAVLAGVGMYLYGCDLPWKPLENGRFSDRVLSELKEEMEEFNAKLSEPNVVPLRGVGKTEGTKSTNEVPPSGVTVSKARERVAELVKRISSVNSEEDLLSLVCENFDLFGKLYDRDSSRAHVKDNVNWYLSNGDHEHKSIRDRIMEAALKFGNEAYMNVLSVLEENNL